MLHGKNLTCKKKSKIQRKRSYLSTFKLFSLFFSFFFFNSLSFSYFAIFLLPSLFSSLNADLALSPFLTSSCRTPFLLLPPFFLSLTCGTLRLSLDELRLVPRTARIDRLDMGLVQPEACKWE